jgi:hypothetical protein
MDRFNKNTITISSTEETNKWFSGLDKIRPNNISFSRFLGVAAKEYTERHNTGDYKIEDFVSEEVSPTPKFFAEIDIWKRHILELDNVRYNEFSNRLEQLNNIKRIKLGGMLTW